MTAAVDSTCPRRIVSESLLGPPSMSAGIAMARMKIRLDSLADSDAQGAVRLLHALAAVLLELEQGPDRVHVLRHDIRLLVDRLEVVQALAVDDVDAVPPHGDLVQVRAAPRKVPGDLHDLGRRLDAVAARDESDSRESPPYLQDLSRVRRLLQVHRERMQVHDRR